MIKKIELLFLTFLFFLNASGQIERQVDSIDSYKHFQDYSVSDFHKIIWFNFKQSSDFFDLKDFSAKVIEADGVNWQTNVGSLGGTH